MVCRNAPSCLPSIKAALSLSPESRFSASPFVVHVTCLKMMKPLARKIAPHEPLFADRFREQETDGRRAHGRHDRGNADGSGRIPPAVALMRPG